MRDFLDVRISGRATSWMWVNTVSQPFAASHCIDIAVNIIYTSDTVTHTVTHISANTCYINRTAAAQLPEAAGTDAQPTSTIQTASDHRYIVWDIDEHTSHADSKLYRQQTTPAAAGARRAPYHSARIIKNIYDINTCNDDDADNGQGHRHSDTEEYTPGRGQAGSGGYGTRIRQTTPAAAGGVRGTLSRYIVQENQSPPAASSSG